MCKKSNGLGAIMKNSGLCNDYYRYHVYNQIEFLKITSMDYVVSQSYVDNRLVTKYEKTTCLEKMINNSNDEFNEIYKMIFSAKNELNDTELNDMQKARKILISSTKERSGCIKSLSTDDYVTERSSSGKELRCNKTMKMEIKNIQNTLLTITLLNCFETINLNQVQEVINKYN